MSKRELKYWKERAKRAERYISECPCDPDIYADQLKAWESWNEIVKQGDPKAKKPTTKTKSGIKAQR